MPSQCPAWYCSLSAPPSASSPLRRLVVVLALLVIGMLPSIRRSMACPTVAPPARRHVARLVTVPAAAADRFSYRRFSLYSPLSIRFGRDSLPRCATPLALLRSWAAAFSARMLSSTFAIHSLSRALARRALHTLVIAALQRAPARRAASTLITRLHVTSWRAMHMRLS